jgi:cobalt-zinc-cadmium efflux system outer membrane protein
MRHLAYLFFSVALGFVEVSSAQSSMGLEKMIDEALSHNFEIMAYSEDARAEKKKITTQYNLSDPSVGISRLDRGLETEYLTVQQKIKFPTKYYLAGKSQKKLYQSSKNTLSRAKLETRKDIIEVYYSLYAVQKTIQLTKINLQLVKDFARVAEKKYAARKSTQSDSMKAHFEITQLELNLLNFEQEESVLQAKLATLLGKSNSKNISLSELELDSPKVNITKIPDKNDELDNKISQSSPALLAQKNKYEAMKIKRSLAKWEFAPDFNIQYQQRISGLPEDSNIFSINATIPLWFWSNSAESSRASAIANAEKYRHENLSLKLKENIKSLKIRIKKTNKALVVYTTTLMPQAEGAYRTSRSAYKAGKVSFLDLLDAERSLYSVKLAYYKALSHFARDVASAETLLGESISNIPGMEKAVK